MIQKRILRIFLFYRCKLTHPRFLDKKSLKKFKSFDLDVFECDGHDVSNIFDSLQREQILCSNF